MAVTVDSERRDSDGLIKVVRSLDQKEPEQKEDILQRLWQSLAASTAGQFHAAEESSLRWLLKSMHGSSGDAETRRRHPLSWSILGVVFGRIPLFSLAKSLADRKFIAILQQTVEDISKPSTDAIPSTSSKRKRSLSTSSASENSTKLEAGLKTGEALFHSLRSLLTRIDDAARLSSHDMIGAEHIRSLFCTSGSEAASMASWMLKLCDNLLSSDVCDEVEGREHWIETVSRVWDLHLQSHEDALEVAVHLFNPSASILNKLEGFARSHDMEISAPLRTRWTMDLRQFMHRCFISPARAAFLGRQDLEPIVRALDVAKGQLDIGAPAMYYLASVSCDPVTQHDPRRWNTEWVRRIFQVTEEAVRNRKDRNAIIRNILDQTIARKLPVHVQDLRRTCRTYAVEANGTDWGLVAKISTCEPGIFQGSEDATSLLKDVCSRSISKDYSDSNHDDISDIVHAVMRSFRTARDLTGFLKLWVDQLCKAEQQKSLSGTPWLQVARTRGQSDSLQLFLETDMSPTQLVNIIEWVSAQTLELGALCLFTDTLTQGIQTEAYVDAVGSSLHEIVSHITDTSSTYTAPKWHVVSKTIAWFPQAEGTQIWSSARSHLAEVLETRVLTSPETFEAFKCCCGVWAAMSSNEQLVEEPAEMVKGFTARLADEINAATLNSAKLLSGLEDTSQFGFPDEVELEHYLAWYLHGCSRLSRLCSSQFDGLPPILERLLAGINVSPGNMQILWDALLRNENNINDNGLSQGLIDSLAARLDRTRKEKSWPGPSATLCLRTLSSIPLDAFSRPQRERIMSSLHSSGAITPAMEKTSIESWKLIMSLELKLMSRPTFYDGMSFSDLANIADGLIHALNDRSMDDATLLELIERFSALASSTIRQMAEHIEERSVEYLTESTVYLSHCESQLTGNQTRDFQLPAFYITLTKALSMELSQSSSCQSHLELSNLFQRTAKLLADCIAATFSNIIGNEKFFMSRVLVNDLRLFAAIDAVCLRPHSTAPAIFEASSLDELEKRSDEAMWQGDLRGWKIKSCLQLRGHPGSARDTTSPKAFGSLENIPAKLRLSMMRELFASFTTDIPVAGQVQYLKELIEKYRRGNNTDGQLLAIQCVVDHLRAADIRGRDEVSDFDAAHSELTKTLPLAKTPQSFAHACRILCTLLEKNQQTTSQWNVELSLSTICELCSMEMADPSIVSFTWLCKLTEIIIKKHRVRIEGHYHLLLATLQALLGNLITVQSNAGPADGEPQASKAGHFARLITLITEPTAGAVSRSQQRSALDSATDSAKRSAGWHMYLILMQYVKLQLEANVPGEVSEVLEPAMNSIFDITPPEGRKILNDALDSSGRAILREMFKRYSKFGKWSGV